MARAGLRPTLCPGPSQTVDLSQEHYCVPLQYEYFWVGFVCFFCFVFGKTECLDQGPGDG